MTELKPNHIQIDVSKFDPQDLEYAARSARPTTLEETLARALGEAYLEQKDNIIPAEPRGLGAVVLVKYTHTAESMRYVKADDETYGDYSNNSNWIMAPESDWLTWNSIIKDAEGVEIISEGVKV